MQRMTVEELEKKRKSARWSYILYGLFNLAVLLVLVTGKFTLGLVLLGLSLLYYFLMARPDIKGYSKAFRVTNVYTAMAEHMENVVYHGKEGIAPEVIQEDKLLPVKPGKSCLTFHRITGEGKGMELELSDVTFQVETDNEKLRAQFISGSWVRIKLDHGTGQRMRLVSRMLVSDGLQRPYFQDHTDFRPMEWGDSRVDQEFCSYALEGKLPEISESVLGRLMDLVEYTPGSVAMALEDDMVIFMICHRFVSGKDPGLKYPITQEMLESDPFPELDYMMKIATACRRM